MKFGAILGGIVSLILAIPGLPISAAGADATSFLTPSHWTAGDAWSTYQEWDALTGATGNSPDVGHTVNPTGLTSPTLSVNSPGFLSGSANFYSFSADYSIEATIYSHGGAGGAGAPAGYGTQVIVQAAASINSDVDAGVFADLLRLVDPSGNPIGGGANGDALYFGELWRGTVSSSFGEVTQQELLWEFYLSGYVGDFKVLADVSIHSMFRQLRVDSLLVEEALPATAIPEPASLGLMMLGGLLARLARRRHAR